MARLPRPYIPLGVRYRAALMMFGADGRIAAEEFRGKLKIILSTIWLPIIADHFKCDVKDLRLDHDPPLAARKQVKRNGVVVRYEPDANDPEYLVYRPHGQQFDGSHYVKTYVRGEHGQYPDVVLIKRERRRAKKAAGKSRPKRKIKSANRWPPKGARKIQSKRSK